MDHGPVQFRFDSTQRKNQVIIYDSVRYSGKSSEWYFVRRNQSTLNETYRCVHCRGAHEKARRAGLRHLAGRAAGEISNETASEARRGNPGARITIREERFMTDPDVPLGMHICDFKNTDNSNTHVVWARRALLRANSELRFNPEKPKLKFQKLLKLIEDGEDEYAHLSLHVRQMIITFLGSNNGFDSRRRSFARNNSLAVKRMQDDPQSMDEYQKESINKYENTKRRKVESPAKKKKKKQAGSDSYICGWPSCRVRFTDQNMRAEHRYMEHPEALFVENKQQLEEYRRMGNAMEEIIIPDNCELVVDDDDGNYEVDEHTEIGVGGEEEGMLGNSLHHDIKEESMVEYVVYENGEGNEQQRDTQHDSFYVDDEAQQFMLAINNMLDQIRGYADHVAHDPMRRDLLYARVQNLLHEAGCSDQFIEMGSTASPCHDSQVMYAGGLEEVEHQRQHSHQLPLLPSTRTSKRRVNSREKAGSSKASGIDEDTKPTTQEYKPLSTASPRKLRERSRTTMVSTIL